MTFKTVHRTGKHNAIIDGFRATPFCKTEIELVRELAKCGIHIKNYTCTDTCGIGFNLEHTWIARG
jgi:hypothetical protein